MKRALSILALAALTACGGGGGGGSGGGFIAVAPAPAAEPKQDPKPLQEPLIPVNTNCVQSAENHINCDLIPGGPYGPGVPAGQFVSFTNRTGVYLQIDQIHAYTAERESWSEYCAYLGGVEHLTTAQFQTHTGSNLGEVACAAKNIGEDYEPIRFGGNTGLSVAPGEMVMLNTHTEPAQINHTFSIWVSVQATGVYSWRQPQADRVIPCDDQMQHTDMVPWRNNTGRDLHLTGASVYVETPSSRAPNTIGNACIYVLTADGSQKYANCEGAIRSKGEVSFPPVTVAPGEYVAAQATHACRSGSHWNWAAFLRVW